jgi:hypothetical protein
MMMLTRIPAMSVNHLGMIALVALAVACSGTNTAPELAEGTFVLRKVAGVPLPTNVRADQFGGTYVADTLRFTPLSLALFAEPTAERRIVELEPAGATRQRVEFVTYDRDGNDFQFSYPCGPGSVTDCMVGFATGTLLGDTLVVIAHPNSGLRSPLVYERIR